MPNCQSLDPLVTPFVDGALAETERRVVEDHLRVCPPCHSRFAAERAVRELLRARKPALCRAEAPDALHLRCTRLVESSVAGHPSPVPPAVRSAVDSSVENGNVPAGSRAGAAAGGSRSATKGSTADTRRRSADLRREVDDSRRSRAVPYALAASLAIVVGGAFLYQATDKSARVMAAELVADHAKCFALNGALGTHQLPAAVEQSMAASFDWRVHLPDEPGRAGLELVGARPCLYGEGRVAHIMYRHDGEPVSLFMLPQSARRQELVEVFGHEAAIWCANDRTFVLVARQPRQEVERMAAFVRSALH